MITEDDIARLVQEFYARVREHPVLGPIFNGAIGDWPHHLARLEAFWSSVMLSSGRYKGQPMVAHIQHEAAMTPDNFAQWLDLWRQTTQDLLPAPAAEAFQQKAEMIAESLQLGVHYHRQRKQA